VAAPIRPQRTTLEDRLAAPWDGACPTPPPWLRPIAGRLAELAPLTAAARLARLNAWAQDEGVRSGSGRPLRFVPAAPNRGGRGAYERRVHDNGEVPTRDAPPGDRHDLYNALMWLAWPRAKARLNALHAAAADSGDAAPGRAPPTRGRLADALTLLDENGVLWLSTDRSLTSALRAFDWPALFVRRRAQVHARVGLRVLGHGLLARLDAPYKAITAHALPLPLPAHAPDAQVDAALAERLGASPLDPASLAPLPVLGFPGWCDANADPAFYNDPAVFRPGRRRTATAPASATR
jgi:hypothetical protein